MRRAARVVAGGLCILGLACGVSKPLGQEPADAARENLPEADGAAPVTDAPVEAPAPPLLDARVDEAQSVERPATETEAGAGADARAEAPPPCDADAGACPRRAVNIAVGGSGPWQACALFSDGTVECWVNGTTMGGSAGAPRRVPKLAGATAISVEGGKACALIEGGKVACWTNTSGQPGGVGPSAAILDPVMAGVTAIAIGNLHSCVLIGGAARCWGYNNLGALGDGSRMDSTSPVPVSGLTDATSITVAAYHSCALVTGGAVQCWGDNSKGQLGLGANVASSPKPVPVPNLGPVTAISANGNRTCVVLATGQVACWGERFAAQGVVVARSPVTDPLLGGATAIGAGWYDACAVVSSGALACWGGNNNGELGDGTTSGMETAHEVPGLANVRAVSASYNRVCALLAGGDVSCWGARTYYSTGITDNDLRPVPVTPL